MNIDIVRALALARAYTENRLLSHQSTTRKIRCWRACTSIRSSIFFFFLSKWLNASPTHMSITVFRSCFVISFMISTRKTWNTVRSFVTAPTCVPILHRCCRSPRHTVIESKSQYNTHIDDVCYIDCAYRKLSMKNLLIAIFRVLVGQVLSAVDTPSSRFRWPLLPSQLNLPLII